MTVKELIDALMKLPENSLVIMSKDAEGNGFSPLAELGSEYYEADSTWSGELVNEEDLEEGEELSETCVPAVCLWPTN